MSFDQFSSSHPSAVNPQKQRTGLTRLRHALGYSLSGLRAGWAEAAFRQEVALASAMIPLSFWLGREWTEVALLGGSVVVVLIVELLNSAIEAAIDRISADLHPLSKRAKDLGSAAVLVSMALATFIWIAAVLRLFA